MAWRCGECGTVGGADDPVCIVCTAPRPVRVDGQDPRPSSIPVVPAPSDPALTPTHPFGAAPTRPLGASPAPDPSEAGERSGPNRRFEWIAAAIVLAGVAIGTGMFFGLSGGGTDRSDPVTVTEAASGLDEHGREDERSVETADGRGEAVVRPADRSDTVDPMPDPTELAPEADPGPPRPNPDPVMPSPQSAPPTGGWLLLLHSELKSEKSLDHMAGSQASFGGLAAGVGLYDSNTVTGAADDVWIVGIEGHPTSRAALARCSEFDLTPGPGCFAIDVDTGERTYP